MVDSFANAFLIDQREFPRMVNLIFDSILGSIMISPPLSNLYPYEKLSKNIDQDVNGDYLWGRTVGDLIFHFSGQ